MASPGLHETAQPSDGQPPPCGRGRDPSRVLLTGGGHSNSRQRPPPRQQRETWIEEKKAKGREKKSVIESHPLLTPKGTAQRHGENHIKMSDDRSRWQSETHHPDTAGSSRHTPKIPEATNHG